MSDEQPPPPFPPNQSDPEVNPYAPPTTDPTPEVSTMSDAEALRRPNLAHEASIKGIGALIILGGLLTVFPAILGGAMLGSEAGAEAIGTAVGIGAVAIFQVISGWSLHLFKKWARIACSVLCGFSLLGFPLGTVIGAYFLYVLLGSKGSLVFSDRYQEAMRQTPHLKYRTPVWIWVLLGILVLLLVGLIAFAAFSS